MTMRKYFILTLMTLNSVCTNATFYVDGIFYDYVHGYNGGKAVCVSKYSEEKYTGIINIPDSIFYNGVPYVVKEISNNAFVDCVELVSITIPKSTIKIGYKAFYGCKNITSVNLPECLVEIGENAFFGCKNIKRITIGGCIETIGEQAFCSLDKLEYVYCYAKRYPRLGMNVFGSSYIEFATLHVPAQSIKQYKSNNVWGNFMDIVPLTNEEEELRPDPTLTIQQADNGVISTQVQKGSVYTFTITPSESWKIHSVTFNDVDVTNQLYDGSIFTTPAITTNSMLSVVYELDDIDEVRTISESNVTIQGTSYGARVVGANKGDVISIYTTDGSLYHSVKAEQQVVDVPLKKDNVYIIKIGTQTMKLSH